MTRTAAVWAGKLPKGFPSDIANVARRKLRMVEDAERLDDLRFPPGNRWISCGSTSGRGRSLSLSVAFCGTNHGMNRGRLRERAFTVLSPAHLLIFSAASRSMPPKSSRAPVLVNRFAAPACRAARNATGLSQKRLADEAEVSLPVVQEFEGRAGRIPMEKNLRDIRAALGRHGLAFQVVEGGRAAVLLTDKNAQPAQSQSDESDTDE